MPKNTRAIQGGKKRVERRGHPRHALTFTAELSFEGRAIPVEIRNISMGGVLVQCSLHFQLGDRLMIIFTELGYKKKSEERIPAKVVALYRRDNENVYGLQFSPAPLSEEYPHLMAFLERSHPTKEGSFLRDPRHKEVEKKG